MRARKFKPFIRYGLKPVTFGPWQSGATHEHDLKEVEVHAGLQTLIIDKCQTKGCPYEAARDLISNGGDSASNTE